ncbi:MAG: DMT family transporter [Saprospiraceae bacterium]|nr:DMT family transporter [Saprospiraceae bacterium]
MNQKTEISLASWLQLFILGVIWGSSFILIKRSLVGLSPVEVASFRIAIACVALMPFVITQFRQIDWKKWHKFLFVGLTTTGIPSFCFAFAQTHVDSATAGILNALTPIFTLLISVWLFNARFEWGKLAGVMIGFVGAGLLVYNAGGGVQGSNAWYSLLILVATICYGFNANAVKQFFLLRALSRCLLCFCNGGISCLVIPYFLRIPKPCFSKPRKPSIATGSGPCSHCCVLFWPILSFTLDPTYQRFLGLRSLS